jgi:hypothetical protein
MTINWLKAYLQLFICLLVSFNQAIDWSEETDEEPIIAGEGSEDDKAKGKQIASSTKEDEQEKLLQDRYDQLTQITSKFQIFWVCFGFQVRCMCCY